MKNEEIILENDISKKYIRKFFKLVNNVLI